MNRPCTITRNVAAKGGANQPKYSPPWARYAAAIARRLAAPKDAMANLVLGGKAKYLFDGVAPAQFSANVLPGLLDRTWPFAATA